MATQLDIKIVQNNSINLIFHVKDYNGNYVDITGFSVKWEVKKNVQGESLITKTTEAGSIALTDPTHGEFTVSIAALDTKTLKAGSYYHEAVITDTLGNSVTLTDLDMEVGHLIIREQYTIQD